MREDHHLPKDWPKRVKASILTAISLAHLAICRSRGQAINNPLERIRLAADNDGLANEVATRCEVERIAILAVQ